MLEHWSCFEGPWAATHSQPQDLCALWHVLRGSLVRSALKVWLEIVRRRFQVQLRCPGARVSSSSRMVSFVTALVQHALGASEEPGTSAIWVSLSLSAPGAACFSWEGVMGKLCRWPAGPQQEQGAQARGSRLQGSPCCRVAREPWRVQKARPAGLPQRGGRVRSSSGCPRSLSPGEGRFWFCVAGADGGEEGLGAGGPFLQAGMGGPGWKSTFERPQCRDWCFMPKTEVAQDLGPGHSGGGGGRGAAGAWQAPVSEWRELGQRERHRRT